MSALTPQSFEYVREFVFSNAAIDLGSDKAYLVESRLATLAMKEKIGSVEALIAGLRDPQNTRLKTRVIEAMTTNETSFFRDPTMYDALREQILPEIASRSAGGRINIWCAACSSGQEPYSILMLLHEHLPQLASRVDLLATDLSGEMVEATRAGRYSQLEVNRGLPANLLPKYFEKRGLKWEVSAQLRNRLTVRQMNLAKSWPPLPKMDLVLVRNVLIYFDAKTKKRILGETRRVMHPKGWLILGAAETTLNLDAAYSRNPVGQTSAYRIG